MGFDNFLGCQCGQRIRKSKIVGGHETEVNEFPWQVALYTTYPRRPRCGGSLISNLWILSAAHCTDGTVASNWTARLGEHDLDTSGEAEHVDRSIELIVEHPNFDKGYNGHQESYQIKNREKIWKKLI